MATTAKPYGGWIQVLDASSIVVYTFFAISMLDKVYLGMSMGLAFAIAAALALPIVGRRILSRIQTV